jgi:hypothetical protein
MYLNCPLHLLPLEQTLQAADALHSLLAAMMIADKDGNSYINDTELDEVMLRMKVFSRNKGPKFDEDSIRAAFKSAMTDKGASLSRIHNALREERRNAGTESKPINVENLVLV